MKLWPWSRKDATTTGDLYKELLHRASSKTGIAVTRETALQASAAFGCARVIAEGIAQVPFKLYQDRQGGGKDPARAHHIYDLITTKPNEWQTAFEFAETQALHAVFMGNAYAFKVRGLGDRVVELLPFEPQHVTVERNGWDIQYKVMTKNGIIPVPKKDMWHFRGISWDGAVGLQGIKLAKEAIGLAMAMEETSSRMFGNGTVPSGVLTADGNLTKEQSKQLRDEWEEQYAGLKNSSRTAILFGGLKWSQITQKSVDAQHLEQRRMQIEEVCRFFRVMPIMIGHSDKAATYASAEQMFLAHVVHTLMPWYTRREQSADVSLLTPEDRKNGYYTKHTVQALMRGAAKDRAEYYAKALGSGGSPAWLTQDEVRDLEEYNPMGGSAAQLPIPTNVGGNTNSGGNNDNPTP